MNQASEKSLTKNILEWVGFVLILGTMLYFFAPPSWWQFGVTAVDERNSNANFSLRSLDSNGKGWNFADKRGKVVVINYWATWCPPCRFEMPGLVNVSNEFKKKGVEFVGVTLDENLSQIPPFIEKYQINYQILLPGNDPNVGNEAMSLPTTFLYDKKGNLAKKYTGIVLESTLRADIEDLLKE